MGQVLSGDLCGPARYGHLPIRSRALLILQTDPEKRSPPCTLSPKGHRMVQPETVRSKGRGGVFMGIVVVRSPRCLRGLLRRIFKVR